MFYFSPWNQHEAMADGDVHDRTRGWSYVACWSTAGFHTASVLILYMKNINIFKYKYCLKNKIFDRNEVQEM